MTGIVFAVFAWLVAAVWLWRAVPALYMLPRVPNLLDVENEVLGAAEWPSVAVIVPAKDEAGAICESLRKTLASDYPNLQVVAVDDRSTDATGELMESVARSDEAFGRLRVLHVRELPDGWLGKPHAMSVAADASDTDWLLFTDADVMFARDAIRRAMAYAIRSGADHVVMYPTMVLHGWAERMLISFFQSLSLWAARPWKIADPAAKRDFIGVGAFNLIRKPVYEELGGYKELRMEVLEDMRLGFRVKQAGYAQRVVFGKDLARIRWAQSAGGILRNMLKNMYAAFRFRSAILVGACIGMLVVCLTPFAALAFPGPAQWAGIATLAALALLNVRYWRQTGISPGYLLLLPLSTLLFVGTMAGSMIVAKWRGGVLWRGTLYPLDELRRNAGPLR